LQSKTHWENVYKTKATNEVSWFQEHAVLSQQFTQRAESCKESKIIDVGGGASILVDELRNRAAVHLLFLQKSMMKRPRRHNKFAGADPRIGAARRVIADGSAHDTLGSQLTE
jgi:hypothetical protein